MGLIDDNGGGNFLGVAGGKIVKKSKEGAPGATARTKKDGTIVWETKHNAIEGFITGIKIDSRLWNGKEIKSWVINLMDGSDRYILQLMYDSRNAQSLLNALCNPLVDFEQPIKITPWQKEVDGKKKMNCYVSQNGDDIDWYFTKDDPRGMPEWKQVTIRGKEEWDNYDALKFLETYVLNNVVNLLPSESQVKVYLKQSSPEVEEKTPANNTTSQGRQPAYQPPSYDVNSAPDDDDLPF